MAADGLVVVDKSRGWTSHDVVGKLRRIYGTRKVGHAGTLDPMATGVLLVGIGKATRLLRFLQDDGKRYTGEITFGVSTDSLDAEGAVIEARDVVVTADDVQAVLPQFTGAIEQVPPMVSAIKIGGKKLYELARHGEEVERPARSVTISRLDLVGFVDGARPQATVEVECSSGTYIRSLAFDIGAAIG
ncbi:MAG: tRNA pseudouridine(55) synthase TruB, partial [Acidimicrobiia bacterium]